MLFPNQSVGALLPADVMRQVRYIRRERYRRTREAAVSGEGAHRPLGGDSMNLLLADSMHWDWLGNTSSASLI